MARSCGRKVALVGSKIKAEAGELEGGYGGAGGAGYKLLDDGGQQQRAALSLCATALAGEPGAGVHGCNADVQGGSKHRDGAGKLQFAFTDGQHGTLDLAVGADGSLENGCKRWDIEAA